MDLDRLLFCITISLSVIVLATTDIFAQEPPGERASSLLPPHQLDLYGRPYSEISERQQWRMRIHGLRHAMLHPMVWGTRTAESTENRRIIPLKLFVLRSSEDPQYSLRSIRIVFRFREVPQGMTEARPRDFDPLLEVGFKGEYRRGAPGGRPLLDRSYAVRISAIPGLDSGLYYRSLSSYVKLQSADVPAISPGVRYTLAIEISNSRCDLILDGRKILSYTGEDFEKGFVTLRSSWHPISVESLEVHGTKISGNGTKAIVESGLVPPLPESHQRIEPALKELPVS